MDPSCTTSSSSQSTTNVGDTETSPLVMPVYVTDISGNHWFMLKDIGKFLNYANITLAFQQFMIEEDSETVKKFSDLNLSETEKKRHKITKGKKMINEQVTAQWLMRSYMPSAKQFKKWLAENAINYDETPLLEKYLNSRSLLHNYKEDNREFNTGYIFIATSEYYKSKGYYIIRRSKRVTYRLNDLNSVMLESSMKLTPCLIWKSFQYKSDIRQLEKEFCENKEQSFFRLNTDQLDYAEKLMAKWGAEPRTMADVKREEKEELDKLEATKTSLLADDSILDETIKTESRECGDNVPKSADSDEIEMHKMLSKILNLQ